MLRNFAVISCVITAISIAGLIVYTYHENLKWEHRTASMCFTDVEIHKGDVRIRYGTRFYENPGKVKTGTRDPVGIDKLITLQKTITVYRQTNMDPTPSGTTWHSSVTTLYFRLWLLSAFFCIPPTVKLVRRMTLSRYRRKQNLCTSCGYDLSGNVSGVCPECGTQCSGGAFD